MRHSREVSFSLPFSEMTDDVSHAGKSASVGAGSWIEQLILLSAREIHTAMPMSQAIEAAKAAFASLALGSSVSPQRTVLTSTSGVTLVMAAHVEGEGLGAKIVSIFPRNRERRLPVVSGIFVLVDPHTGIPRALVDGDALTAWRTGAASGAATDLLARPEARIAVVFGSGAQARTQVLAINSVRRLELIRVFSRTPRRCDAFVEEVQHTVDARIEPARNPQDAIRDADIICTATTSSRPVFDGRDLRPGVHINAIGSFTPQMQEVDADTIGAARVFVDSREAALEEAGDLLQAAAMGKTRAEDWTLLGEVVAGLQPGRRSPSEITYFKSVGLAVQDVVAAGRALAEAERLGLAVRTGAQLGDG